MVPASWMKGTSRWDWLNGHGPAFVIACKNGSKFQWLNILYRNWFEVYHVSLPVDVEPVPGAIYPEPVGEATIKEMEAMVTLRKKQLTKEHWLAELPEIQAIIVEKWKSNYEQAVTEWESRNKDIQEPYKQQLAFDNMTPYLKTFLHTFQEHTGLCMMIIVGRPTLNSHGNMVVTCMHQGVTPGPHLTDFNSFAGSLFQDQITPKFIEFLKKVYSRALREEKYGLPPDPVTLSPSIHGASTAEGSLMKQGTSNEDGNSENL
ncbi:hypothetical protein BS47DRAFT_1362570 [Hydnum rufescens UP504]|uniref:Uncharacterized protein n=1 Tax=Hydnum rufescens UP504 TaxID=1448309 RepID=A0A9P6AYQ5_9AGAM|nr:hypothetical protein BS47DRAFT_1362570 [Hydnum rufescens UP504]